MEGNSSTVVNEGNNKNNNVMDLPPGFRFHPTDEEIITHYLTKKVMDERLTTIAMGEVDMNKCEPWDLPKKAKIWGKEWYFFSKKDRKYPTGMRTNRATNTGYWKATGKDRDIYNNKVKDKYKDKDKDRIIIGMKKTLVFYIGRAPKGDKSNWVMHEYRLEGRLSYYNFSRGAKDEWVVCKVFNKNSSTGIRRNQYIDQFPRNNSIDDILHTPAALPPLMEDIQSTNEEDEYNGTSSSSPKSTQSIFSSYFSNFQFQEHHKNNSFIPKNYPNINFNPSSYQYSSNPIQQNPGFLPNSCVSDKNHPCKVERFSSNISMVSPTQYTDISSAGLSNRACEFEDFLEGMSVRHDDVQYIENLWDY